jgi:hypothetical protein
MLLFDGSEKTKNIFDTAYYYFTNHKTENIQIPFFRENMYPDEPFLAIGLAKHDIKPANDWGRFSRTLIGADKIHIDVTKRIVSFYKNGHYVFPQVVHFCGKMGQFFYFFEKIKLYFYFNPPIKVIFNTIFSILKNIIKK